MSKTKFYVGVDVGKATLVAAHAGGKRKSFDNNKQGIQSLATWASKAAGEKTVHICMESTGPYGSYVTMQLVGCDAFEVSLVNPVRIVAFGRVQLRRTKTDMIDAKIILAFAQSQQPRCWQPQSKVLRQLYALVTQLDALAAMKRRLTNRDHSNGYVIELPGQIDRSQKNVERCLDRECAKLEKAITQLIEEDKQLKKEVELLSTIPGVKQNTAVHILPFAKNHLRKYSRKELTAQAGLAPRHHQSGTSINRKSRIGKQGDKRLRKALYMPALCGIVHNPLLKENYQRLLQKGKPKKVALIACMRKLLLIMQAIIKSEKPFNPTIQPLT